MPVTALSATSTDTTVGLTWTNPTSPGLSGVTIRRAVGPVAPGDPHRRHRRRRPRSIWAVEMIATTLLLARGETECG